MPRDMDSGEIVEGALAQARLSLKHCMAILEAGGPGPSKTLTRRCLPDRPRRKRCREHRFSRGLWRQPARNLVEIRDIEEGAIVEIGLTALA